MNSSGVTAICASLHETVGGVGAAARRHGDAPERDGQIDERRLALLGPERHGAGEPAVAPLLLFQRDIEAEPLRVVGDGSRRFLQRLAGHRQELASSGHARRGA